MMVVDTSALMAIVLNEPTSTACIAALEAEERVLISAGTLAEALIVSAHRNVGQEVSRLVDELSLEVVPVTSASARRIAAIYGRWGKGLHPAALNLGDCFAYAAAEDYDCPLLFVGDDFPKTEIQGVL